ncbi:Brefeldin A-inhibited guanine nucleotide-exchange protein 2 [Pelomyxa schiedti]|nr:Brefeldin A-inhibited guanine nucleotide-exchange protein 2 [Pelomyxa schiedti]
MPATPTNNTKPASPANEEDEAQSLLESLMSTVDNTPELAKSPSPGTTSNAATATESSQPVAAPAASASAPLKSSRELPAPPGRSNSVSTPVASPCEQSPPPPPLPEHVPISTSTTSTTASFPSTPGRESMTTSSSTDSLDSLASSSTPPVVATSTPTPAATPTPTLPSAHTPPVSTPQNITSTVPSGSSAEAKKARQAAFEQLLEQKGGKNDKKEDKKEDKKDKKEEDDKKTRPRRISFMKRNKDSTENNAKPSAEEALKNASQASAAAPGATETASPSGWRRATVKMEPGDTPEANSSPQYLHRRTDFRDTMRLTARMRASSLEIDFTPLGSTKPHFSSATLAPQHLSPTPPATKRLVEQNPKVPSPNPSPPLSDESTPVQSAPAQSLPVPQATPLPRPTTPTDEPKPATSTRRKKVDFESLVNPMKLQPAKVGKPEPEIDWEPAMRGITLFNDHPVKGMQVLYEDGIVENTPVYIAQFLFNCSLLAKDKVGDFLSERESTDILAEYLALLNLSNYGFEMALRFFLQQFRLPGESQKIDRLMQGFADAYYESCDKTVFLENPSVYVLAFSLIMLNTDLHKKSVKHKMTPEQYLINSRKINKGKDFPRSFMMHLYQQINDWELRMNENLKYPKALKAGWLFKDTGIHSVPAMPGKWISTILRARGRPFKNHKIRSNGQTREMKMMAENKWSGQEWLDAFKLVLNNQQQARPKFLLHGTTTQTTTDPESDSEVSETDDEYFTGPRSSSTTPDNENSEHSTPEITTSEPETPDTETATQAKSPEPTEEGNEGSGTDSPPASSPVLESTIQPSSSTSPTSPTSIQRDEQQPPPLPPRPKKSPDIVPEHTEEKPETEDTSNSTTACTSTTTRKKKKPTEPIEILDSETGIGVGKVCSLRRACKRGHPHMRVCVAVFNKEGQILCMPSSTYENAWQFLLQQHVPVGKDITQIANEICVSLGVVPDDTTIKLTKLFTTKALLARLHSSSISVFLEVFALIVPDIDCLQHLPTPVVPPKSKSEIITHTTPAAPKNISHFVDVTALQAGLQKYDSASSSEDTNTDEDDLDASKETSAPDNVDVEGAPPGPWDYCLSGQAGIKSFFDAIAGAIWVLILL